MLMLARQHRKSALWVMSHVLHGPTADSDNPDQPSGLCAVGEGARALLLSPN